MGMARDLAFALAGWDLAQQAGRMCEIVKYWRLVDGRDVYRITDRELRVLAILVALDALGHAPGVHRFPSGAVVRIGEDLDSEASYRCDGQPVPSDFPDDIARLLTRMPPEEQPARDAALPWLWRAEQEERREHGHA